MSVNQFSTLQQALASSRLQALLHQLEALGDRYLVQQSPVALPERHMEQLPRWLPWSALGLLLVHVTALRWALQWGAMGMLLGAASHLWIVVTAGESVLLALALPGLFRRTRRGWALLVASLAVMLLRYVLTLSVVGSAVFALCLWAAFQLKPRYV